MTTNCIADLRALVLFSAPWFAVDGPHVGIALGDGMKVEEGIGQPGRRRALLVNEAVKHASICGAVPIHEAHENFWRP